MKADELKLLARIDERTLRIEEKVDKQNGRVGKLEDEVFHIKTWKAVITGQKKLLMWLGGFVVGGIGWLIRHFTF